MKKKKFIQKYQCNFTSTCICSIFVINLFVMIRFDNYYRDKISPRFSVNTKIYGNNDVHHGSAKEDIDDDFTYDDDVNDNRYYDEKEKENNEEEDVDKSKDYCSSDGNVCAYHNICYDITSQSWFTASKSLPNLKGYPFLNDMSYAKSSNSRRDETWHCNEQFVPEPNVPYPEIDEMIYEEGTTYLVCCWVNNFGHILVQMMVSAVHALEKIGLGKNLKSNEINFLVDNRAVVHRGMGSGHTVMKVFDFLTGRSNSVMSLQDLQAESRQYERQNICFEKLVVGMLHDDLVHGTEDRTLQPGAEVGMLDLLRDHIKNIYPLTKESSTAALNKTILKSSKTRELSRTIKESPTECTITALQRKSVGRVIRNFDEVMSATKRIFNEDKWNIRAVSFDGISLEAQYLTVQSSMVFVSVSGTESHLGMFLPNGGTSIEILYDNLAAIKNEYICKVSPNLNCLSVKSSCEDAEYLNCRRALNTEANIKSLKKALESVKIDISNKCDQAIESLTRIGI